MNTEIQPKENINIAISTEDFDKIQYVKHLLGELLQKRLDNGAEYIISSTTGECINKHDILGAYCTLDMLYNSYILGDKREVKLTLS